ncbi:MAG: response regulator transcription factor [Cyanosarcina radialis HA8281-LM2]|jgi:DNA-binding NarL/FixJ family response regulator|nr:response regulator transcription factor [Cyanosarcina radialis HA8281-LM2]
MIRILIVDDQSLICEGLQTILDLHPDLQVVGTASNGEMAIEQVEALQPDLVLMDVRMPIMDGRAATRKICEQFPDVAVLVLSTFDDDLYIAESIRAGAKGYLLKDMPAQELVQAIRLACQGYAQLAPGLLDKLIKQPWNIAKPTASPELETLTRREQEVLQLIANGATNREIAEQLFIREGTVKTHVTHLLGRLNCKNRAQLAIVANSAFADDKS